MLKNLIHITTFPSNSLCHRFVIQLHLIAV
uniref:Uncharacterized protein n=1 Tax=Rhizophora mucronata TaxID=61149 RepID=A0A2P2PRR2_RHIMU